jgi:hypothetical protein
VDVTLYDEKCHFTPIHIVEALCFLGAVTGGSGELGKAMGLAFVGFASTYLMLYFERTAKFPPDHCPHHSIDSIGKHLGRLLNNPFAKRPFREEL